MIEAKVGVARNFYYRPATQDLSLVLTLKLYDDTGALVSTNAATVMADPVGIYETAAITFNAAGTYYYVWEDDNPTTLETGQFLVVAAPLGDYSTSVSRTYRYEAPSFQTGITDLVLKIWDVNGVQVGSTTTTTEHGTISGLYETDSQISISAAGQYLFAWTSTVQGYAITKIENYLVLPSPDTRDIIVYVIDNTTTPETKLQGVKVLLSKTDGTPLLQRVTDVNGKAALTQKDGTYTVSVSKDSTTYSANNLSAKVQDPSTDKTINNFTLYTVPFAAAFDPSPLVASSETSLMTVDLADLSGEALPGASITLSNTFIPDTVTGTKFNIQTSSVANPTVVTTTAAHGYSTGDRVVVIGHTGSTPVVNGVHTITVTGTTTFTIPLNVSVGGAGGTVHKLTIGIFGQSKTITTDGNGHAELTLLRGTEVTAAFEGTSIRRTLTVPAQASFSLLDEITAADDPFDILIPVIASAVRRS